ncbi:MAG: Na+/H+ antiporter subunit E [Cellvibrionaceae bacterium]
MRHTISVFVVLGLIWLFNSGLYTSLLLSLGFGSVLLVVWIGHRMDVVDHESQPFHLTPRLPSYYWWLLKKLIASNINVVIRIWRGNQSISPCIATLPLSQRTDMGRVIYGNSITLTPGTVCMDIDKNSVTVHSLTASGLDELRRGEMDRRVSHMEQ